jgi:hypothetical protein
LSPSPGTDPSPSNGTRALLVAGALLFIALTVWLFSDSAKLPEPSRAETAEEPQADEPERKATLDVVAPQAPVTHAAVAPAPSAEEFLPSHPINDARLRQQRQNQFIQMMNDAMDLKDGQRLRELTENFQKERFDDTDKHGEGSLIIADCLEHPGPAARVAAQAFWDRERGSTLRRHVKRHCLE